TTGLSEDWPANDDSSRQQAITKFSASINWRRWPQSTELISNWKQCLNHIERFTQTGLMCSANSRKCLARSKLPIKSWETRRRGVSMIGRQAPRQYLRL